MWDVIVPTRRWRKPEDSKGWREGFEEKMLFRRERGRMTEPNFFFLDKIISSGSQNRKRVVMWRVWRWR